MPDQRQVDAASSGARLTPSLDLSGKVSIQKLVEAALLRSLDAERGRVPREPIRGKIAAAGTVGKLS